MGGKAPPVSQRTPAAAGIKISQSSYGVPIPVIYGRMRVSGNLIFLGAKGENFGWLDGPPVFAGFGGASIPTQTSRYYFVSMMWAVSEGPIEGIRTLYKRETRYVLSDFDQASDDGVVTPGNLQWGKTRVFVGLLDQAAWDESDAFLDGSFQGSGVRATPDPFDFHAPGTVLNYPEIAYLARHGWPIYQNPELPDLSFDVFGLATEGCV